MMIEDDRLLWAAKFSVPNETIEDADFLCICFDFQTSSSMRMPMAMPVDFKNFRKVYKLEYTKRLSVEKWRAVKRRETDRTRVVEFRKSIIFWLSRLPPKSRTIKFAFESRPPARLRPD